MPATGPEPQSPGDGIIASVRRWMWELRMPELSTENVLVQLQTLEWVLSRAEEEGQGAFDVGIWTFFFKIDGSTFQLGSGSDLGKLSGGVTVQTTAGPGRLQTLLRAGVPIPVPPEVGSWSTSISPLRFQGDVLPPAGGVLGLAAVVVYPSTIESDALAAGHDVFNSALEFKLNTLLTTQLQFMFTGDGLTLAPTPDQIKKLTSEVSHTVDDAIHDATDVWDKIHTGLTGGGYWFESVFAMVSQQQFGSEPFAQLDLGGPFTFAVENSGQRPDHLAGLCGAVTRAQPSVTQTVRAHVPHPVSAVRCHRAGRRASAGVRDRVGGPTARTKVHDRPGIPGGMPGVEVGKCDHRIYR